ncbi:MAG TPA: hypothetical protein VFS90_22280 [Pyrinomonadaceae bacterium]|nr:hypothetical protein [Pyrinomonadaceae bacterium]
MYSFALLITGNKLSGLLEDLKKQQASFADELRKRGDVLAKIEKILMDFAEELLVFAFFPPGEMAVNELQTLGQGFGGLGRQFDDFPYTVSYRKTEYTQDLRRLETRSAQMAIDATSRFRRPSRP